MLPQGRSDHSWTPTSSHNLCGYVQYVVEIIISQFAFAFSGLGNRVRKFTASEFPRMKLSFLPGYICLLMVCGAISQAVAQSTAPAPVRAGKRNAAHSDAAAATPAPSDPGATPRAVPATPVAADPATVVTTNATAGDYVLTKDDIIEMVVYKEPDLTTKSQVATDGTVQFPLVGDIKLAGLTVREARELLRKRYDQDYIVNPQVYLN